MAKINHMIFLYPDAEVKRLIRRGIVSAVTVGAQTIVARHGVNKTTLRKILEKNR